MVPTVTRTYLDEPLSVAFKDRAVFCITDRKIDCLPTYTGGTFVTQRDVPLVAQLPAADDDAYLVFMLVTPPAHGTLELLSRGTFTYTPDAGFVGDDTFTFSVTDLKTDPVMATAQISVVAP